MDILTIVSEFLKNPNTYGVNLLIIGALFILSSYHFFLYIQSKDKTYLYYHLYTGFTLVYLVFDHTNFFNGKDEANLAYFLIIPLQWIYNSIYVLFIKELTAFKRHKPAWNKVLNTYVLSSFICIAFLLSVALISSSNAILSMSYNYLFLPSIVVITIVSLGKLFFLNLN